MTAKPAGTPDTAAIIVAGGKGLRFGGPVRKQYLRLRGRPILWWSLQAFEKSPSVVSIILVVPTDDREKIYDQTRKWKLKKLCAVGAGGHSRTDSVRRGLSMVSEKIRYVAVHDAVRPLVTPAIIESVIRAARKTKAALAATPGKDTVKLADAKGCVHSTPDRASVWLAQTPQVFERALLERAHRRGRHLAVTDDAQLVERLGVKVKLVPSPVENLKITRPIDLVLARTLLKNIGYPV